MKNIIILILLVVSLSSCCANRPIATSISDSVRVEVRTRTEYIRDTVTVEIPMQAERITTRDTTSHLENDYAQTDARINPDGSLYHSLETKPQQKPLPVELPIEHRDSIVYRDKIVKDIVQVERNLSWWQKTQIKGFWVAIFIIVFAYRRKLLTLIRCFCFKV